MLLFVFESGDASRRQFAAANQRAAAKLPAQGAPWRFVSSIDVRPEDGSSLRVGAPSNQVLNGIAREGYFMWDARNNGHK